MTDDSLSHLDDKIAEEFAQVGWRPAERGSASAAEQQPRETAASRLATVLSDLAIRIDALEHRIDARNASLQAAFDDGWAKVEARLEDLEASLVPARMAAETLLSKLGSVVDGVQRDGKAHEEITAALQSVQASMKAQSRVLEAVYDVSTRVDALLAAMNEQRGA
jgi:hypothetical protein